MEKKKIYVGSKNPEAGGRTITVHIIKEDKCNHYTLKHIIRHSPTGIQWGYLGSGSADCALSILVDHLGEENFIEADELYQYFKIEVISRFQGNLCLFSEEIEAWIGDFRFRKKKGESDEE